MMKLCQKLLATMVFLGLASGVFAATDSGAKSKPLKGTQGYRDEIGQPPEPYKGPPRTGAQVYAYRCAACHAKTTQGAPMPGDDLEWGLRAKQGMKVLMQHTVNGYKQLLMPPRGGCRNCSDAELKAAIVYMLKESGVKPPS